MSPRRSDYGKTFLRKSTYIAKPSLKFLSTLGILSFGWVLCMRKSKSYLLVLLCCKMESKLDSGRTDGSLIGEKLIAWHDLVSKVAHVVLGEGKDIFAWNLNNNGSFSVSSMKVVLGFKGATKDKNLFVVPQERSGSHKDNLAKRQWKGNLKCSFCNANEMIQHLFLTAMWQAKNVSHMFDSWLKRFPWMLRTKILLGAAALCWAIWLSRNDMVFNRFLSNSFKEIIFRRIYWIRCWAKFSIEDEKEVLEAGCRKLEQFVLEFGGFGWRARYRMMFEL
ncbi:hypothetical protein U9M48_032206, partial [Paspalum notatum var. saurae]